MTFHGGLAQLGERLPYKQRVTGSSPVSSIEPKGSSETCGSSSVVEHHLAMVGVASSNLVFRFHSAAGVAELVDAADLKSAGE